MEYLARDIPLIEQYFRSFPEKSFASLEELTIDEILNILTGLSPEVLVSVLNGINAEKASQVIVQLSEEDFKRVHSLMDPVRFSSFLSKVPREKKDSRLNLLDENERKDIEELSSYPADSAGSLMDTSVQTCHPSDTVVAVVENFRKLKAHVRDIFVVSAEGELIGYVPLPKLFSSPDDSAIERIMHQDPPYVNALSPREEVTDVFETFKTTVLPVVHVDGTLLGAIRYKSLVSEIQNEAMASMATMQGASPSERAMSPPLFSVWKRLPWLTINLLTAFIASAVVGFFEETIAKVTALAVLLPIVAGQSGNTGAQAMAVTMRGLALREVRTRQWAVLLFKEMRVGLINGIAIALITGASVYFWSDNLPLGTVMTAAMIFSMIIASVSGAAIPIILTSMGKDPAQSSSVILTTVTDVMGFLSFLGLATLFVSLLV